MRTGKIPENVLTRSVLRQINRIGNESIKGADIGEDCALLAYRGLEQKDIFKLAVSTQTVALPVKNAARMAVTAAANNLAAGGAEPDAAFLSLLLPKDAQETLLKELMKQAGNCCSELGMQIAGGHTEVSPCVQAPVITVTALGRQIEASPGAQTNTKAPGQMELVVSKWIAMEGTALIAQEREEELSGRYSVRFIREAQSLAKRLSVAPEAAIALKSGVYTMHDTRNGGIFAALWEISRRIGVGLTTDLKKIPVKQETIEICEFYDLNPYELLSGGMLLMVTQEGQTLVQELERAGIPAAVIGQTSDGNDKVVTNQGDTRYLEPPAADEILKLFYA